MDKTVKITLGEDSFDVPPMNIGQVEDAAPIIVTPRGPGDISGPVRVIQIALREAYPEAQVRKLTASLSDIQAAYTAVDRKSVV